MLDESSSFDTETPEPQPEEKGNRTFLIVGGIFAALIFLTLSAAALYFLFLRPRLAATQVSQAATAEAQRLEQAQAMTATAQAAVFTPTSLPTAIPSKTPTNTAVPQATPTSVVILASPTAEEVVTLVAMDAAQTQLAGQMTQTAAALATIGAGGQGPLPTTGFFDEVGLPLLVVVTVALLVVILIARQLRRKST